MGAAGAPTGLDELVHSGRFRFASAKGIGLFARWIGRSPPQTKLALFPAQRSALVAGGGLYGWIVGRVPASRGPGRLDAGHASSLDLLEIVDRPVGRSDG